MTRKTKIRLIVVLSFVIYAVLVWVVGQPLLHLRGTSAVVFYVALLLLGLVAAGVTLWFLERRDAPPAPAAASDDVDAMIGAARSHLTAARLAARGSLASLPMVLVIGPDATAKTTAIVRSGLEPDLLAGEVQKGDATAPTRSINLWYSQGTVFVEAGGKLAGGAAGWHRLLHHLQPRRLAAIMGRGRQAPRVAVVCFSCEELVKPGRGEAIVDAARKLRARLGEISQTLGIRLPVYVLFTKADRIPHFADYVQNFTRDEVQQVLGATLPADFGGAGSYADRETARLTSAFDGIFQSLASKRLQFLPRENAPERKPGAYEFPREIRKLTPAAVEFLVELCKPSQLQVSPVLRGFYLSGVQAVIISDVAPTAAAHTQPARSSMAMGATGVFTPGQLQQRTEPAAATPTMRKVPRWLFLERLFRDVILGDEFARGLTHGGTRVNLMRRALLGVAALAMLLLATGFTVSYLGNRDLQAGAAGAARLAASMPVQAVDLPSADALARLDTLRAEVARLGDWDREGAPWGLRWGLYSGSSIYPALRRSYFDQFQKLMFAQTRTGLLASLRSLPDTPRPTDDYGTTYGLLKGYLITTNNPEKSSVEFLSPVLMTQWLQGRSLDPARSALAKRQFDFYSAELVHENPFPAEADRPTVAHARDFLSRFGSTERIYQFMLTEASARNPSIQFNRKVPGSASLVRDTYEVPGAFTKGGWSTMQDALGNVRRYFEGERWVLGEQSATPSDLAAVADTLRRRYVDDYEEHWRAYLRAAEVVRPGGLKDASQRLSRLAGNQSPLLALLAIAAQNTDVDSQTIGTVFQPVHAVTPPGTTAQLIGEKNASYMQGLVALQTAIDQAANSPPGGADAAVQQAIQASSAANSAALTLSQPFHIDTAGHVESTVTALLRAPIAAIDPMLRNFGAGELNGAGASFCGSFRKLLAKFPFDPSSSTQASIADLNAVFRPGTGSIWLLYNQFLQKSLTKQGSQYVPTDQTLSPGFVSFFNRAADVSEALYPGGRADPRLSFRMRPTLTDAMPVVTLEMDGAPVALRRGAGEAQFVWVGRADGDAKLSAQIGGTQVPIAAGQGTWSIFQLFQSADSWRPSGAGQIVEWTGRGAGPPVKVIADVTIAGAAAPVLKKGYFTGLGCVSRVAR